MGFEYQPIQTTHEIEPNFEKDKIETNDFYNPSTENSIKPSKFLTYLDIDFDGVKPIEEKHFHFPVDAMLKLIPFKILNKIRWNSVLVERLKNNVDDCAKILGFNMGKDGKYVTPSRPSLSVFFNERLGLDGHRKLLDHYVMKTKEELDKNNIPFGERVGLDSTPLPTLKNDIVGTINGHYYKTQGIQKMVKVHTLICLDTGIPIATTVSDGLVKARTLGINPKEVYADGHYNTFENWAKINIYFNTKCYFNLAENDKCREDGTKANIQRIYQKHHNNEDWKMTKNFNQMIRYLVYHDDYESVGAYFRNEYWKLKTNDPNEYKTTKGKRALCENLHSILKEQLNFDKHLPKKGWTNIEMYVLEFMITILMTTYIRGKNGIKEGFMKLSDGVFS